MQVNMLLKNRRLNSNQIIRKLKDKTGNYRLGGV